MKSALEEICDCLTKDFEKLMDKAEKKNDMILVLEVNSLKWKRSETHKVKYKECLREPWRKRKKM